MTMTATSASISTSASASTDCSSSMQGSTTSSASSDVMTLTTTAASSWCAIPTSSRLRVLRLVRPHQRRLLAGGPERASTYGFAVRGGREHGTGFFVSHVEHGGEAQLKGLRIGDQILRINGFRLDDAVHKEFIQLVGSQDRVTLKVRGVGMLPVRDQPEERLSWSVVKLPSVSGTPSESSFKTDRRSASRDISVVLHVAPRTKLGLGICKGPEWKPGIFVQFTKERSVAREAGLRPGDQILSVNSIDFSDVLFSEAVAVMKSSSKLDMVVRTAAGCDLFPGESSGYNSSASSVTGDQSPCWADAKSKRLTAVREEAVPGGGSGSWSLAQIQGKQLNKTIIKLSENGTSINNTFIASHSSSSSSSATDKVQSRTVPPHSSSTTMKRSSHLRTPATAGAAAGGGCAPIPPPPKAGMSEGGGPGASEGGAGGSSLSSAITEELKKRKEKQQQQRNNRELNGNADRHQIAHNDSSHRNSSSNSNSCIGSHAVAQVSHRQRGNAGGGGAAAAGGTANGGDQHTALMDEFKRAHQRMFRNGFHESEHKERGETLKRTSIMPDDSCYRNITTSNSNSNSNGNGNINSRTTPQNSSQSSASATNTNGGAASNGTPELPPPPPQFANPQPRPQMLRLSNENGNGVGNGAANGNGLVSKIKQPMSPMRSASISVGGFRPPATPQPDYDAVQLRSNHGTISSPTETSPATAAASMQQQQQRRTLRLGTVTIGEYGEQRTKRETLRKVNGGNATTLSSNGILKNGSNRSSASFSQHGEKTIKFGN
ncbi:uncharacterized protein [Drosophila pseudoobscura]|uniref:PDZ domain-containing protein n=1 Tax=Drosophila pseudoobscura pseudoobscura TaxID=46245 RepID=A0A6I8W9K5_DROPS|nr:uncharacterized protein LOC6901459 [Drosophila pseudoobscura]